MKSIFLTLIITISIVVLIAFVFRSKRYGKDALYLGKKTKARQKEEKS
jgi:uncharacterized protein YxeA